MLLNSISDFQTKQHDHMCKLEIKPLKETGAGKHFLEVQASENFSSFHLSHDGFLKKSTMLSSALPKTYRATFPQFKNIWQQLHLVNTGGEMQEQLEPSMKCYV